LDIDGTLINSEKQITPRTKAAIHKVRQRGVSVVLISARMPKSLEHICKQLEIPVNIVAFNGSVMKLDLLGGKTVEMPEEQLLSHGLVQQCHEVAKDYADTSINIYSTDRWLTNNTDRWTQREMSNTMVDADITDLTSDNIAQHLAGMHVHKVLLRSNPATVQLIADQLSAHQLTTQANTTNTRNKLVELTPHGVDKGKAVRTIGELLGVPVSRMMAFGDADNDVEMLDVVDYGFAMAGCSDRLRAAAYEVVGSNNEEGVAKVLEREFDL